MNKCVLPAHNGSVSNGVLFRVFQSQAKFDLHRARQVLYWVEEVTKFPLDIPDTEEGIQDQLEFGTALKDGQALCHLINALQPGTVKRVNTMKAPFKQRENLEMFLKGCEQYGMKSQDLFQVNDLYENKNLYMVSNTRGFLFIYFWGCMFVVLGFGLVIMFMCICIYMYIYIYIYIYI
ncbi:UNVERIFIED_CONTAM: hypothetical protein GTU68_038562 [Idotea baltica]|nr:hypothetical protein [Idotea baltica]